MTMGDLMTRNVPHLQAGDSLEHCAFVLRKSKLDGLPVVDTNGKLIGIFTKANLIDVYLAGVDKSQPLEQYYNRQVVTVNVDTPYVEIENLVRNSPVGMGVVVDAQGRVAGIFSKVDMIMALFKQAEQLATHLNTVYNAMYNGVIVVDRSYSIKFLNDSGQRILKLRREELQGMPFNHIFPGIDLSAVLETACCLVGVKESLNGVASLCNISPMLGTGGTTGAIIIFQTLNDLDSVASELESTKQLYETLLTVTNIAYEAVIVIDDQGRISLVNDAACKFFARRESELLNRHVDQVVENTGLPQVLKTGMAETNEIQVIAGRPYVVSRLPIIRGGKIIGAVGKITYQQLEEIKEVAERLEQMHRELSYYKEKVGTSAQITFKHIVTVNQEMRNLKQEAAMVARGSSTVMLTGESGTGKELFAEAIHTASPRYTRPFVKVNCAAIPENLLESEFFGYASGAFTGARKGGKDGKLAIANGGTLFLDEIGDMPLNLQGKLLRVLEDRSFEPVGSNHTLKSDVRIIAATNQDLLHKVASGAFRSDLFYRLNVISFKLLPLRDRPEDIVPLVQMLVEKISWDLGKQVADVSAEVRKVLLGHYWPGNVRELRNVVERAVNYAMGPIIQVDNLPFYLREQPDYALDQYAGRPGLENSGPGRLDKKTLLQVLGQVHGNKSEAARLLGISRSWLYEKMRRYDLV